MSSYEMSIPKPPNMHGNTEKKTAIIKRFQEVFTFLWTGWTHHTGISDCVKLPVLAQWDKVQAGSPQDQRWTEPIFSLNE